MAKRKAKSSHKIGDKKKRGEWVELRFMAEAAERDLPASKPLGDSENFDVVVGRPGKFVAVQVKCTIFRSKNGEGYLCSVCSSHKVYQAGAFDFLAAYVVPEDGWFILPAKEIQGMRSVSLCTPAGRYEKYREAWELLREAVGVGASDPTLSQTAGKDGASAEDVKNRAEVHPTGVVGRMEASMNFFRRELEQGGVRPLKQSDEE
ncbi:MAG TPA: group I intron-associated PD-(D/E)XK endonuclease [Candidatus Sulfotelmatobacter sp.]